MSVLKNVNDRIVISRIYLRMDIPVVNRKDLSLTVDKMYAEYFTVLLEEVKRKNWKSVYFSVHM